MFTQAVWTIGATDTVSSKITVPEWTAFAIAKVPAITNTDVRLYIAADGSANGTFSDVLKDSSGNIIYLNGAHCEPCIVDISTYLQGFSGDIKLKPSGATGNALTGYIYFKSGGTH